MQENQAKLVVRLPDSDARPILEIVARSTYRTLKPLLDAALAALMLVLLSPVMLLAALAIKLTSRGPAIYTQTRLGLNGKPFTIIKLRTMTYDCEAGSGAVWCQGADPRVTAVGRFLRATHIDEFPQLINILLGQMSLIGPRPERPEIVARLETQLPGYRERLTIRPGITGLAQVQLPPDTSLEDVRKKLVCDRYYIDHLAAWLDLRILLATGLFMFAVPLSWSRQLLGIPEPLRDCQEC